MGMYISKNGHGYFFLHIYAAFHSSSSLLILKKGTKIYLRRYLLFFRKREKKDRHTHVHTIIYNRSNISHCFCYYYYVLRFVLISPSLLGAALLPPSILKWLSGSLCQAMEKKFDHIL